MSAYLGVTQSLTGRRWVGPGIAVERQASLLEQSATLPPALALVLARRGVEADQVTAFLDPKLRDLLPDPCSMRDMEPAAARILRALETREKVAIFADYDVDGGTSAALLIDWFRHFGRQVTLYVPDRIDEGYGPNEPAMAELARGHDLIICVDCGTLSHAPIEAAKGADVVVLDHHLGGETLPAAVAVVNPNRQDEDGALGHLCAAGVVFLCLVELGRQLREIGKQGPDLMALLDLVALGTVADVAPLIGVNRALVRQGLKVMGHRARTGLVALSDVARLDSAPSSYHLGYVLGPRVNAGGRIGQADLGARLLSTTNEAEAKAMAERLDQLNSERREIEAAVRAAALDQAEQRGLDAPLVWAAGTGWHPGVVGIVASRLKELTNRPAIVIGFDGDDGKGSGRSVAGVDLGASIQRLAAEGLLVKGGGHKMAAGLSLTRQMLEPAMARLSELLAKQGAGDGGPADLRLDGTLMPGAASPELVNRLEEAGPYGASAPAPRFAFPDMAIRFAKRAGDSHLRLSFSDGLSPPIEAIAFGAYDSAIGTAIENHGGKRFHLAGKLDINTWGGRQKVQLRLDDAAEATG
ncbi:single-stranded-DNA-specific exonuclease RecJ [Marinovum sp. 2_MG-2023]|uniref:single-stranded-DNA-specific exonuclease RecJ n=1 Tax=unclassified Marinovum TaxID=2647166 RepID=UPI0026E2922A|nr:MULTISPECIES: single-stranded-DNA-specific exonuclease RecJ [unclassified Marinovum]MDO6731315.1 single-stranded-DNA-specific exonuclease RecJ [Marinovum sp. 2_MG-2023]MDO6780786.1 single-stranded-DNA-specific exonuclease RecJ [Marinovum sp. 1_MG-2023]